MYNILIQRPDEDEKTGQLIPGTYRIGKSPASHIQIDRPEVSSRHAVLHVKDNQLILVDAGSTNGTFLNGTRLKKEKEYLKN